MELLEEVKPRTPRKVIELVSEAGVDVSDWANFKGGKQKAASNPKYCYEWAFLEPGKVAVLNIWHDHMIVENGTLAQDLNYREIATQTQGKKNKTVWVKRAQKVDEVIKAAFLQKIPLQAIICLGEMRNLDEKASQVRLRRLDNVPWHISSYDLASGQCRVVRGLPSRLLVDQFSIPDYAERVSERKSVSGYFYPRSEEVRRIALNRAKGKCEWCGEVGFIMDSGEVFLETHHIIPLSQKGQDTPENVAALCPTHHREAHLGQRANDIRESLIKLRRISTPSH